MLAALDYQRYADVTLVTTQMNNFLDVSRFLCYDLYFEFIRPCPTKRKQTKRKGMT